VIVRRETVESYCFFALLLCCVFALLTWLLGMLRPKGFGALPAALWISLLTIVLLCSGVIGILEFSH
jgi:hypothetical protein